MKLSKLASEQFPQFFEAVHGYPPFRWQSRMASEVLVSGNWPEYVSLPTSAGKTALIDIAVFALACEAHLSPAERKTPLRTFFVIDRRVVADEAFSRATKISKALDACVAGERKEPILRAVTERLLHLAGEAGVPLHCALLRGGITLDDSWIRSPLQPSVCVSTVDQVGSRLLFRGYGVSPRLRPIHASLVAHDSLMIVDEAHISEPFCETAKAVQKHASRCEIPAIRPLRLVQMTATAPVGQDGFVLLPDEENEPELSRRISTPKPTSLEIVVENSDAKTPTAVAKRAVELAQQWGTETLRVIGVVVNRVQTARQIFDALQVPPEDKVLFIGRIRSLDRDRLWEKWRTLLTSDPKERIAANRSLYIVATQTIEVGADLDFDALISEIAPIDALRQRFGRLNRRGRDIKVKACILTTKEQTGTRYQDAVYKKALAPTFKWLQSQLEGRGRTRTVNFSYTNLKQRLASANEETRKSMVVPPQAAPLLHPSFLNAWACTASPLMHDPDIEPFLHGLEPPRPEVQIVWRADFDTATFDSKTKNSETDEQRQKAAIESIELLPPSSREALPLPYHTAIRWLQELASADLTDAGNTSDAEPDRKNEIRTVIVVRSDEQPQFARGKNKIRPGDIVVVPSYYGGADAYGWIGTREKPEPVSDLAELAAWEAGRPPFIRFHPTVLKQHGVTLTAKISEDMNGDEGGTDWQAWIAAMLEMPVATHEDLLWRVWLTLFQSLKKPDIEVIRLNRDQGAILRSRRSRDTSSSLWANESQDNALQTYRVSLRDHLSGVARYAERFARDSGLPTELVSDICLAAQLHDLGKADPRTQIIFHGSESAAFAALKAGVLLAKSEHRFTTMEAYLRLMRLAGLPTGARHETLSVSLAESEISKMANVNDPVLVLHDVAAHHGFARPLLKSLGTSDIDPETVDIKPLGFSYSGPANYAAATFQSDVPVRFLELQHRYGWWGLAWLETLLRLADWSQSADEQTTPKIKP